MSIFKKTVDFKVDPSTNYKITVIAGQGQLGRVAFRKPDGQIVNQELVEHLPLGKGDTLLTKEILTIGTMVTDVQPDTNRTSVIIRLNGTDIDDPFEEDAEDDNGSVFYKIKIRFQS